MRIDDDRLKEMMDSILTLYNYKLPFVVAEYFCYIYLPHIECKKLVRIPRLFTPFKKYKNNIKYIFQDPSVKQNPEDWTAFNPYNSAMENASPHIWVRLSGMEFIVPKRFTEVFMDEFSTMFSYYGSVTTTMDDQFDYRYRLDEESWEYDPTEFDCIKVMF